MDEIFAEKYDQEMDYIFPIIFGNTDDEEEEFQGFTEEDVKLATKRAKKKCKKFKSLLLGKGIEKHRKSFKEGQRKSVHDQDYRKVQESKYVYEPTFSALDSSENNSNSCDETDYLKSWIFRETDDEDEEFEGFTEEDLHSNAEVITKNCFKKEKTDGHSKRENDGEKCITDEMQRCQQCSSLEGRDDEGMFSDAESDGEMDVKWFTHVMKILESSIEKDENDENDQRILRQNLNKVFGLNKEEDIMLKVLVKK